jgi:Spy/CpxP family protein refolding chaperone
METELILSLLESAPILGVLAILYMMKKHTHNGNGNGANLELTRSIAQSIEKLADAQAEANQIAERRARGFERWLDIQSNPFQSKRNLNQ